MDEPIITSVSYWYVQTTWREKTSQENNFGTIILFSLILYVINYFNARR
jgi:hypothetical protein